MEKDFYKVDQFLKITKEIKPFGPEANTVNGEDIIIGPGFQAILRIYFHEIPLKRVSFFFKENTPEEEYQIMERSFIETLCKSLADPIFKFLNSFKKNVALQA